MRKATGFLPALGLGVAGAISTASPSLATPITYTETATATGFLGSAGFTGATVTLTMNNTTGNVTGSAPIFDNVGTLMLSISGGGYSGPGTATFNTDTFQASDNQNTTSGNPAAGFGDVTANRAILFTGNAAAFASYNLQTPIGPIVGTSDYFSMNQTFPTNDGNFVLTTVTSTSFTATIPAPVIGHGLPGLLAIGGVLFGAKLFERSKRRRLLEVAIRQAAA
jgi:hypothetical protein